MECEGVIAIQLRTCINGAKINHILTLLEVFNDISFRCLHLTVGRLCEDKHVCARPANHRILASFTKELVSTSTAIEPVVAITAIQLVVIVADGGDPAVQKRLDQIQAETLSRTTFLLVAEEYLQAAYDRELAEATMRKKVWHVETLAAPLHHRPINAITAAEILHLLKEVEHSGRRETAKELSGTLSGVFRLAVVTLRADSDSTYAVKGALLPVKVTSRAAITDEKVLGSS